VIFMAVYPLVCWVLTFYAVMPTQWIVAISRN